MPDQAVTSGTLAGRLDALFRTVGQQAGIEPGYQSVVDAMASNSGLTISATYLYMLRTGRRDNPRVDVIRGLAAYFHVPAGYLLDTDHNDEDADRLTFYRAVQQAGLLSLVGQLQALSPASREAVALLLNCLAPAEAAEAQGRQLRP